MSGGYTDFWTDQTSVYFTSLWGWSPETWGAVGWTKERGLTRRSNLLKELTDPFIAVCYVTSNKTYAATAMKGKIAGFYLVSHEIGDRDAFTHPSEHALAVEKWRHSLRALRAFTYLPEYQLSVDDFDSTIRARARSVSAMGEILTNPKQIDLLRKTPCEEVEVYSQVTGAIERPSSVLANRGMVQAGPASAEGYVVANGSQFLPRELYVLRLEGDTDAFLGQSANGRFIVKVGLAASPEMRRQTFQKAMPRGAYQWKIDRTSTGVGIRRYPGFAIAAKGEEAMKRHLAKHAEWLGGEFYLATQDVVDAAWHHGCEAAQNNFE